MDDGVSMGGRTDRAIMTDVLRTGGLSATEERLAELRGLLAAALAESRSLLAQRGRAMPGATDALRAVFALRPGWVQSVLTGNIPATAQTKLAAFGLDGFLDLAVGAYGEDHVVRSALVAIARTRFASAYGRPEPVAVLVGDTPHDVRAAREAGARAVAVASGRHTVAELSAAGADVVLPDLRDTAQVLASITGRKP
jgi:phosphoglycolate phosphatase